jgi:hypothetical protein
MVLVNLPFSSLLLDDLSYVPMSLLGFGFGWFGELDGF